MICIKPNCQDTTYTLFIVAQSSQAIIASAFRISNFACIFALIDYKYGYKLNFIYVSNSKFRHGIVVKCYITSRSISLDKSQTESLAW